MSNEDELGGFDAVRVLACAERLEERAEDLDLRAHFDFEAWDARGEAYAEAVVVED